MFPAPGPNADTYLHTPSLKIDILRDKAAMYRVSPTRIETLLRNAYSQNYVYLIKKSQDQYQVILEATDQMRQLPEDLEKLYIEYMAEEVAGATSAKVE